MRLSTLFLFFALGISSTTDPRMPGNPLGQEALAPPARSFTRPGLAFTGSSIPEDFLQAIHKNHDLRNGLILTGSSLPDLLLGIIPPELEYVVITGHSSNQIRIALNNLQNQFPNLLFEKNGTEDSLFATRERGELSIQRLWIRFDGENPYDLQGISGGVWDWTNRRARIIDPHKSLTPEQFEIVLYPAMKKYRLDYFEEDQPVFHPHHEIVLTKKIHGRTRSLIYKRAYAALPAVYQELLNIHEKNSHFSVYKDAWKRITGRAAPTRLRLLRHVDKAEKQRDWHLSRRSSFWADFVEEKTNKEWKDRLSDSAKQSGYMTSDELGDVIGRSGSGIRKAVQKGILIPDKIESRKDGRPIYQFSIHRIKEWIHLLNYGNEWLPYTSTIHDMADLSGKPVRVIQAGLSNGLFESEWYFTVKMGDSVHAHQIHFYPQFISNVLHRLTLEETPVAARALGLSEEHLLRAARDGRLNAAWVHNPRSEKYLFDPHYYSDIKKQLSWISLGELAQQLKMSRHLLEENLERFSLSPSSYRKRPTKEGFHWLFNPDYVPHIQALMDVVPLQQAAHQMGFTIHVLEAFIKRGALPEHLYNRFPNPTPRRVYYFLRAQLPHVRAYILKHHPRPDLLKAA